MKNWAKTSTGKEARYELHDTLSLTGAEISINSLPAGSGVPFVHSHRENEEIYGILEGKGTARIDGETVSLEKGDWLRISPEARRQFSASDSSPLCFVCIQVRKGSLGAYTASDAIVE